MANAAPTLPANYGGNRPFAPVAVKGDNATLRASLALTANYVESAIVTLGAAASIALQFLYDSHASATANQCKFLLWVSNASGVPAIGDDEWSAVSQLDISPADAILTDSLPGGADMTVAPAWGERFIRPSSYTLIAMTAHPQKQRPSMIVNVRHWKYFVLLAKEEGDTTNLGTLAVNAALQT